MPHQLATTKQEAETMKIRIPPCRFILWIFQPGNIRSTLGTYTIWGRGLYTGGCPCWMSNGVWMRFALRHRHFHHDLISFFFFLFSYLPLFSSFLIPMLPNVEPLSMELRPGNAGGILYERSQDVRMAPWLTTSFFLFIISFFFHLFLLPGARWFSLVGVSV